jgi:phosphoserine phosphatase RsbU/P
MRSRFLNLRLWLERYGLFPQGRLAFIAWYFFGLDILLVFVQKVADLLHRPFGNYLNGWIVFLSLVVIVLFSVIAGRRLSSKLLWRLRNRLIVTYVFIGVIPLLLLAALALGTLYLFAGQFATFIGNTRLQAELRDIAARNQVWTHALGDEIDAGHKPENAPSATSAANDAHLCAWIDRQLLINNSKVDPPTSVPGYLAENFAGIVREGNRFFLRSAASASTRQGKLQVLLSRPLDSQTLLPLAADLGELTFFDSHMPKYSVGNIPPPRRALDIVVGLPADLPAIDWVDGKPVASAAISVRTRFSKVYDYLLPVALGDLASTIAFMLFLLAIVLAAFELAALVIGTRLTSTVTGAVGQIYLATTHVNRGDFSHRIPITSSDQLAALATSFNSMTESLEKLLREQQEKQRLENEITIAQEVQAQLFPRHITQLPSLEVHGFCRPARSVSGDYYDFLPLGAERMVLAVGDVSGKGISAALLMATIHSAVRAYSMEGIPAFRQAQAVGAGPRLAGKYESMFPGAEVSPGTLLSLLNHQLYNSTPMEKYATLFLAMYDGETRRLTFSNAGHLPPMVIGESGSIRRLEDGGTVVGLFDDLNYDEASVQLRSGDIFLAYSDGVTEPENDYGEFGEQRLADLVQENRDLPLQRITEIVTAAVDDWIGAAEQPDDVTLVLARAR